MKLQRRLYSKATYEGLNETEKLWLRKRRGKLAQDLLRNKDKSDRKKLLKSILNKAKGAEEAIKGGDKLIKEAVNAVGDRKLAKIAIAKKLGRGALIAGGITLGIGMIARTVSGYKKNKNNQEIKKKILES